MENNRTMENSLKLNAPNGAEVTMSFDPSGNLLVSLQSDDTPLEITVQSQTQRSSQKWVGGMKKH